MLLFIPYEINSFKQRRPIANWIIVAVTVVISLKGMASFDPKFGFDGFFENMVLIDWHPSGLFGHLFLHLGFIHLAGNMLFLWVFGNALCSNMNNFLYLAAYLVLGLLAGCTHLIFDPEVGAVGASGAVNGIIGLALAVYPRDEVSVFYLFIIKAGTFELPVWVLALIWLGFDIWGASSGAGSIAYSAHIGGLAAGVLLGLLLLQLGKIDLTIYDRQTLLEFFKGEQP